MGTNTTRFNRNILGCKGIYVMMIVYECIRFNRNILGCKVVYRNSLLLIGQSDLIETYWDVKGEGDGMAPICHKI